MNKSFNPLLFKINFIIYTFIFTLILISGRLFYLQIIVSPALQKKGQQNFLRFEKKVSPRGDITDRNGKLLATNRPMINLYWQGTGNYALTEEQKNIIKQLESITNQKLITEKYNTLSQGEKRKKRTLLVSDLSLDQLAKIEELFPDHKNISLTSDYKRFYPYNALASHTVGYLGRMDLKMIGKMGLEKIFENTLQGQDGQILKKINSFGTLLNQTEIKQPLAGESVQTTLDLTLQQLAESIFPDAYKGTCIIMNPENGDILTLVSRPSFDPSIFLEPITTDDWLALQEEKPFLNRGFNASYPPGSIFKLITTSAALEYAITTTDAQWHCPGYTIFAKRKYWCHRHYGHGDLNTHQSLAQSCNIMFFEIAKKIDIDLLAQYAYHFGLGRKTDSLFPEKNGLIPTRAWKEEYLGERWWQGETLSASIGQSFLLVTPIQIACMISSIFTGYLVKPRILMSETIQRKPIDIKPETLTFLRSSMRAVVTKGTGKYVSRIRDITIHAKTSTAQTSHRLKRHLGKIYKEHAWFVAHFSYKQEQPLTLILLIENAGSSRVATGIAKKFLLSYKAIRDQH